MQLSFQTKVIAYTVKVLEVHHLLTSFHYCETSVGSCERVLTTYHHYQHPDHYCLPLSFLISRLSL